MRQPENSPTLQPSNRTTSGTLIRMSMPLQAVKYGSLALKLDQLEAEGTGKTTFGRKPCAPQYSRAVMCPESSPAVGRDTPLRSSAFWVLKKRTLNPKP